MTERWIECECPRPGGFDFDIDHAPLPGPDAMIYCTCCGGEHRIGDIGQFHIRDAGGTVTLGEDEWRRNCGGRG